MSNSNSKKTGRKLKHHVSARGETIVGLSRRPSDGRWRIIEGPRKGFTFTEPDEQRAIERFYQLTGRGDGGALLLGQVVKHQAIRDANKIDWRAAADVRRT